MPDKLTFYTIVSAFWMAFLAALGINIVGNMVMPTHEGAMETFGYPIEVAETAAGGGGDEGPAERPAIQPLIAAANMDDGAAQFRKCASCHTVEAGGRNMTGPNLNNIVGAEIGDHNGFSASDSLKAIGGTWTYDKLDDYLENPKRLAPRGTMSFAGLRRIEERAAVIKYLMAYTDNPPELVMPAEEPAEEPAAEAAPMEGGMTGEETPADATAPQ